METLDQQLLGGLAEQARSLRERAISSRELVEAALDRAERTQETLNAFRVICREEALATAEQADRRLAENEAAPLLGVPVAIKDDVDLHGHTTPFGCGGGRPAVRDAEAVRRLREAGAIVIGKTHAPEVGQWHFTETPLHGATRNPWNTDHTPGGSSGGAAAAVAANVVPAAIGSDGAGSIRIPAAWTGLVGLKPQRGRVSTWPDPEAFNGLSCYGPLARSADDAALLLDAIRGNVPADLHKPEPPEEPFVAAAAREPRRLRVAISFVTPIGVSGKVHAEHRETVESFARRLEELGHDVFPADPDYGFVGPALIPRGMAGVEAWLAGARRRPLDAGAAHSNACALRQGAERPAAAPLARRRAQPAAADRPHLRALRPRPHAGDGDAAASRWRARGQGLLGDEHGRQRDLPLRLRLERDRLAGDQRSCRAQLEGPADRRAIARPRERRGDAALAGGPDRARHGRLARRAPVNP